MTKTNKIVSVILAAGEAKRMGKTKQLLSWGKHTLIEHVINQNLQANVSDVFVILGADIENIKNKIKKYPVKILENTDWKEGIASSIVLAANTIVREKLDFDALLITLADQPLLETAYLNRLIDNFGNDKKAIVATSYGKKAGVPALFHISYLEELSELTGDVGASAIIQRNEDNVIAMNPGDGVIDIDTPEVYNRLRGLYLN